MDTIEQITATLKSKLGANDRAYLFGSRARGTARNDSDWDILVIMDKDKIRTEDYDSVSYPLTTLGWDTDQIITPILYTQKEWEAQSITPFYDNVQHDAIRLI